MNNQILTLDTLEDHHIQTILNYFPSFKKEDITDIKLSKWLLEFRHKWIFHTCYSKFNADLLREFNYWVDFCVNFFPWLYSWILDNKWLDYNDNLDSTFINNLKEIISSYFNLPDGIESIHDISLIDWFIVFHYQETIFTCPIYPADIFVTFTNKVADYTKNIWSIILDYNPKINLKKIEITKLSIYFVCFKYNWENFACSLVDEKIEQIRQKELEAFKIEKPLLRRVK